MMKNPLFAVACCFALGAWLGHSDHASARDLVGNIPLLLAAAGLSLLLGLVLLRASGSQASGVRQALPALLAFLGFISAGAATARLFASRFPPNHTSHWEDMGMDLAGPVVLEGYLAARPTRNSSVLQFDLEATELMNEGRRRPVSGKVRLWVEPRGDAAAAEPLSFQRGDFIRAEVRLRRPRVYRNPGSFDFRRRLESIEDVYWEGTVRSPRLIEKLPERRASGFVRVTEEIRGRLLGSIDRLYPPWAAAGRDGAVLKAVLLGDRSALDSATVENFRRSGLYHLLVIAGLHVGLLAMLVAGLFRMLGLGSSARSVALLLFLLAYASVVEQRAPTLRATLMIVAWVVARLLDRDHAAFDAIGIAALALLVSRPAWLLESGFQLSFTAALLIAGLAVPILMRTTEPWRCALRHLSVVELDAEFPPRVAQFRLDLRATAAAIEGRFSFFHRYPVLAALPESAVTAPARIAVCTANILLFSAVLQLGLLLSMVETFHRVTFAGIGLNALAIPVMTALLAIALPVVLLGCTLTSFVAWPARILASVVSSLLVLASAPHLPGWLSYRVPEPPSWIAWCFAVSTAAVVVFLGRSRAALAASLASFAFFATLISLYPFPPRLGSGLLEVTALDCGGDATLVVLPEGTTLLVGAGGGARRVGRTRSGGSGGAAAAPRWDPGENIVSPYLWSRGVRRIDILVLPDPRGDHLAGFASVLENFRVGELWVGPQAPAGDLDGLFEKARESGVRIRRVARGDVIRRGSSSVQILWPPASPTDYHASRSAHYDPLVMRISGEGASVLLPGSADAGIERELLNSGADLESRVLKVAREGAGSSSGADFLARVAPRVALISVEGGDAANLPNPETLDRLWAAGARILRTDLDGAVTVEIRGSALRVRTYNVSHGHEPALLARSLAAPETAASSALSVR